MDGGDPDMVDKAFAWNAIAEKNSEIARLRKTLDAACGYLLNAKIDLETGCPKRTAITTIEGGLKMIRDALNGRD